MRAGVHVSNVRLSAAALQRYSQYSVQLAELSLGHFEVQLPSWRRRLGIRVRGVSAEVRQRQMPEVQPAAPVHACCCSCHACMHAL